MHDSAYWNGHFTRTLNRTTIDWSLRPSLNPGEHRTVLRSLQAWQLGETSDGAHLLTAATRYARSVGDPDFLGAIKLFIAEEQKHGENLGKYLDLVGVPRLKFDLGDWMFRRVRYLLASIETWTTTVLLVESVAELYYATLAEYAGCPLLRQICREIVYDEAFHIRFQCERLGLILQRRSPFLRSLTQAAQVGLYGCVVASVWLAHRQVFELRGWGFGEFSRKVWRKLQRAWLLIERSIQVLTGTHGAAAGVRW